MKILHILAQSYPYLSGYSVRSHYILLTEQRSGEDVVAITYPDRFLSYNSEDTIEGITYYHVNIRDFILSALPIIKTIYSMQHFINKSKEILKTAKPDIIHSHSPWRVGLAGYFLSKVYGLPFIYEVRGLWEETDLALNKDRGMIKDYYSRLNAYISRSIDNFIFKRADAIIAISHNLKKDIINRGLKIDDEKIFIVPNGVDTSLFSPIEKDIEILNDLQIKNEVVIGYISSIRKIEGIEFLIKAVKILNQKNIKVVIVGEGGERKKLELLVKRLNLEDRVIFVGKIPHERIRQYYSIIDIFVVPRTKDYVCRVVTPLKPLEAMAMGRCLLISDVEGLTELVNDEETGLIFESENIEDLADKLAYLISNKDKREELAKNALNWVKNERDWVKIVAEYSNIYKRIIS
ncbi:MAG: glycosyltransferase family 4 protein [Halobacteriota archaeon]|nr:glycosyltransferase family 4 protein [Halobacteriota archaeon]